eukprot:6190016-Pleurochrysis_carterae.AAC.2
MDLPTAASLLPLPHRPASRRAHSLTWPCRQNGMACPSVCSTRLFAGSQRGALFALAHGRADQRGGRYTRPHAIDDAQGHMQRPHCARKRPHCGHFRAQVWAPKPALDKGARCPRRAPKSARQLSTG